MTDNQDEEPSIAELCAPISALKTPMKDRYTHGHRLMTEEEAIAKARKKTAQRVAQQTRAHRRRVG